MKHLGLLLLSLLVLSCGSLKRRSVSKAWYDEPHRLQIHFSPKAKWMNDPNGLIYFDHQYHLFYQHYPDSTVWGPMHWGHATSKDLINWEHQPIALYPDSLGYIFSGSAVADVNNTSGFGGEAGLPIVAIFTHHEPKGETAGRTDYQNQSLAYSLDKGKTWTKYAGNPVLKNPGVKDFRDPKVFWYEEGKKWIMALAMQDRIGFFSSPDLKNWTKQSEFGAGIGAHGGVWECPDLFALTHEGKSVWFLLVSINPGGPNGGSATQYFAGEFDGQSFKPFQTDMKWIDWGPDDYAGVTFSNTGQRKIFLGWMSNWQYGTVVPTRSWRSAMTLPRDLTVERISDQYYLRSLPVPELNLLAQANEKLSGKGNIDNIALKGPSRLQLKGDAFAPITITLSNTQGQKLVIGYDRQANQYYIDRSASGLVDFEKTFASKHTATRYSNRSDLDLTLVIDDASVELFADGGVTVMTEIFFSAAPLNRVQLQYAEGLQIDSWQVDRFRSIWK